VEVLVLYTLSKKHYFDCNCDFAKLLIDFQNCFTDRLVSGPKFAIKLSRLTYVATLPCKMLMSKLGDNLKRIVIKDKSQGSVATHLGRGLYGDHFILQIINLSYGLLVKEFLKISEQTFNEV